MELATPRVPVGRLITKYAIHTHHAEGSTGTVIVKVPGPSRRKRLIGRPLREFFPRFCWTEREVVPQWHSTDHLRSNEPVSTKVLLHLT